MLTRAGLERLAQRLEDVAAVLRQLVEKQHAAMRERNLARPQPPASADHGRRGGAMVRRAKRRPSPLGHGRQRTDERMHHRAFERRVVVEWRQEPGQALRQHALARAGRADEEQAVSSGGGNLERAPRGGTVRGHRQGQARRRRSRAARRPVQMGAERRLKASSGPPPASLRPRRGRRAQHALPRRSRPARRAGDPREPHAPRPRARRAPGAIRRTATIRRKTRCRRD